MHNALIAHTKKMGLSLHSNQINLLLEYLKILQQWNQVHNLCAKADPLHMLGYHLLDSLSVATVINCENKLMLDVGTGAGLPGIPLAIIFPEGKFTLLDARSKKMIFLQHVINKLHLNNVTLELTRIENYNPMTKFDLIISRGFGDLKKIIELTSSLIKDDHDSKIIAMKADPKDFVIGTIFCNKYIIKEIIECTVPLVTAKRCLIMIQRSVQH